MSTALQLHQNHIEATEKIDPKVLEQVVINGDLEKLSPPQRVAYYRAVCESTGLNPLTKPFDYLKLNGQLRLYARKDAADQLRKINGISISSPEIHFADDLVWVSVTATDRSGRADADTAAVPLPASLKGEARANAVMKCVTKAKRRVTLSMSGLGWLDENEVETIPNAQRVTPPNSYPEAATVTPAQIVTEDGSTVDTGTGEITEPEPPPGATEPPAEDLLPLDRTADQHRAAAMAKVMLDFPECGAEEVEKVIEGKPAAQAVEDLRGLYKGLYTRLCTQIREMESEAYPNLIATNNARAKHLGKALVNDIAWTYDAIGKLHDYRAHLSSKIDSLESGEK